MNKNFKLVLVAATVASFAASAHTTTNALVDDSGAVVKNDFGQCVEVVNNEAKAECGGAAPQPKIVDVPFVIPANALFDTAKAVIRPKGRAQLAALAKNIKEAKQMGKIKQITGVKVVGHTDSRGSNAYNQGLSERRAASVRNFLVSQGIPANMITAFGEGEMNPVATNATPAGRQQNRRVNITVSGIQAKK
ncbi:MAG: cell envelope biogenesis protein OmpA [Gammaproteobacteria bacterium]|nr:MAG: cell envelope biogenesis protein OmpA [Gammaproteobacteria bacterium]